MSHYNLSRFRTVLTVVRDILHTHIAGRDDDELPSWLWSDVRTATNALEALDRALARAAQEQDDGP